MSLSYRRLGARFLPAHLSRKPCGATHANLLTGSEAVVIVRSGPERPQGSRGRQVTPAEVAALRRNPGSTDLPPCRTGRTHEQPGRLGPPCWRVEVPSRYRSRMGNARA